MNIAICDDQLHLCQEVNDYIEYFEKNNQYLISTHIFISGKKLLESQIVYDIIFLDIEIEEENGLEIAAQYVMKHNNAKIIFLTSHIEEMPNGYKVKAFRFLLKPINKTLFFEALESAAKEITLEAYLIVKDKGKDFPIRFSDIVYVEAGVRCCGIRTLEGFYRSVLNIERMRKELSTPNFYTTHRSYIINLDYVDMRNITDAGVVVCEGEIVKISRLKEKAFKETFFEYIRSK